MNADTFDYAARAAGEGGVSRCPGHQAVTVVLTSCGRPDLLTRTLSGLFQHNAYPITKLIIVEDGPTVLEAALGFPYQCNYELICTGERIGQIPAIDYAYSRVKTPFIFHLEDDWEFYRGGFIEKSLVLLQRDPRCLQVYVRARNDTNGHPVGIWPRVTDGVAWRRMKYGYRAFGGEWNGFSFNPGLRRLADYIAVGGYGVHQPKDSGLHASTEIVLSRLYRQKGMYAAILADRSGEGYVRHIGWHRTVSVGGHS